VGGLGNEICQQTHLSPLEQMSLNLALSEGFGNVQLVSSVIDVNSLMLYL
jgi:hypothetical protein